MKFDKVTHYGLGTEENYCDRNQGARPHEEYLLDVSKPVHFEFVMAGC